MKYIPAPEYNDIEYDRVVINLTNGDAVVYEGDDWDDYVIDTGIQCAIIKKDGAWIGIYNLRHVISIQMLRPDEKI